MTVFRSFPRARAGLIALAAALVLAGCRVEVYDGLSQRDANQMTALLLTSGIDAKRKQIKDGTFAVTVGEEDFARAVQIIERSGLPKPQFATIVDVLSDDRLIASPGEERARLNFALSQELSRTVSEIDGVVSARVHIATPSEDPLARRGGQSSASVAIHHRGDFNTAGFVPRIKMLIANAVDDLDYERVSIALFPTTEPGLGTGGSDVDAAFLHPGDSLGRRADGAAPTRKATLAALLDRGLDPAMLAILGGGLIVLLLAAHTILFGNRKSSGAEERPRRRSNR